MYLYEDTVNALELYESGDLSFYDLVESVEDGYLSEAIINEYFAEQFEFVEAWQNGEVSDEELVEAIESGYLDYELVEGVIGNTVKKVWNSVKGHTQTLSGMTVKPFSKSTASKLLHKAKQSFYDAGNKDKAVKLKRLANSMKDKKTPVKEWDKPKNRAKTYLRTANMFSQEGRHDIAKHILGAVDTKKYGKTYQKKFNNLKGKYGI